MKELRCRDAGFECDVTIRAATEMDLMWKAEEHLIHAHGLPRMDVVTQRRIRSRVRES